MTEKIKHTELLTMYDKRLVDAKSELDEANIQRTKTTDLIHHSNERITNYTNMIQIIKDNNLSEEISNLIVEHENKLSSLYHSRDFNLYNLIPKATAQGNHQILQNCKDRVNLTNNKITILEKLLFKYVKSNFTKVYRPYTHNELQNLIGVELIAPINIFSAPDSKHEIIKIAKIYEIDDDINTEPYYQNIIEFDIINQEALLYNRISPLYLNQIYTYTNGDPVGVLITND